MISAAMLALAACTESVPELETETVFTAVSDGTTTKTALGEKTDGKYPVIWSEGDCIIVNGVVSKPLTAEAAGSNTSTFTMGKTLTPPYTAIYPADALNSDQITIKSEQMPVAGNFDPATAIMAAQSETTGLRFRQLCAYLRIKVNYPSSCDRQATKAVFRGNASESVAGQFSFNVNAGNPVLGNVSGDGVKTITLTPAGNETSLADFCIAIPPQIFKEGFSIMFSDDRGTFLKATTSTQVELKAGVITNAPELTFTALENTTSDIEEVDGNILGITWDKPVLVSGWCSAYGRAHRLNDGRLMICYSNTWHGYARFSNDDGATWTGAKIVVPAYKKDSLSHRMDNPEFAQLSASNPHHPGRIIYAVNERVKDTKVANKDKTVYPFHISISTSDDNGATWSSLKKLYSSNNVSGCYEPFVLELPDGIVQIYFADETPYARDKITDQNISVIESKDGGDTWGEKRVVCYTFRMRDGMPTATVYNSNIYVAIEANGDGYQFFPQIVYNTVADNWSRLVGAPSIYRFDPFQKSLKSAEIYSGAPYLIQTDNYFVMSYQTTDGAPQSTHAERYKHTVMEVQICPKSEFVKNKFSTMRGVSRPFAIDQTKACAKWNSLCPLGGDEILAVYGSGGRDHEGDTGYLYVVRGRITNKVFDFK